MFVIFSVTTSEVPSGVNWIWAGIGRLVLSGRLDWLMGARVVEAVELDIEHVGHPGEGMPVAAVTGGQGPDDAGGGEAAEDVGIAGDVGGVVKVDEVVAGEGKVEREGDEGKDEGDEPGVTLLWGAFHSG